MELQALAERGWTVESLAFFLHAVAFEREAALRAGDVIELVWTGPELPGAASRDTGVVVRELFTSARLSVLVSGFAVYGGREIFAPLADTMDRLPGLAVRFFLNIAGNAAGARTEAEVVRAFGERFRTQEWPGQRLPEVYYDPRSFDPNPASRAVLHAKCVVVDGEHAFVTSANLTEAAQQRNIEAGVLIHERAFARALAGQFEALVGQGIVRRLPGS